MQQPTSHPEFDSTVDLATTAKHPATPASARSKARTGRDAGIAAIAIDCGVSVDHIADLVAKMVTDRIAGRA